MLVVVRAASAGILGSVRPARGGSVPNLASVGDKVGLLFRRLDALGNDVQVEAPTKAYRRPHNGVVVRAFSDVPQKRAIDVNGLNGKRPRCGPGP